MKKTTTSKELAAHSLDKVSIDSFEEGLRMNLAMLRELKEIDLELFCSQLKEVQDLLAKEETPDFKPTDYAYYQRDKALTEFRTFLLQVYREKGIFSSENTDQSLREVLLQSIATVGSSRLSAEDMMILYNLLKEEKFNVNLQKELSF